MTEHLQEYVDSRGVALRVDRAAGVLRGVKLIGLESLNGRRYRPEALSAAVSLYEGAKVNVNHPKEGPLAPRDYRDRLGVIRQVEFRADEGLFGNLHFNPKHALAEQLAWDAENNPRNVGFSHNVLARLARDGEQTIVEAITHVQSVDLVADPAATQGLFEETAAAEPSEETAEAALARLNAELQEAAVRERQLSREVQVYKALSGQGCLAGTRVSLKEAVGPALFEALLAAPDEEHINALLTERIEVLRKASEQGPASASARPRSVEPLALFERREKVSTAAEFARAIKSGGTP
jgi:hypothetical protein